MMGGTFMRIKVGEFFAKIAKWEVKTFTVFDFYKECFRQSKISNNRKKYENDYFLSIPFCFGVDFGRTGKIYKITEIRFKEEIQDIKSLFYWYRCEYSSSPIEIEPKVTEHV
jgi:hypothetical protein